MESKPYKDWNEFRDDLAKLELAVTHYKNREPEKMEARRRLEKQLMDLEKTLLNLDPLFYKQFISSRYQ